MSISGGVFLEQGGGQCSLHTAGSPERLRTFGGQDEDGAMFETERLVIRRFRDEDARPLYENHLDDEVRRWFPNECYADLEEARDAIRFYAGVWTKGNCPSCSVWR